MNAEAKVEPDGVEGVSGRGCDVWWRQSNPTLIIPEPEKIGKNFGSSGRDPLFPIRSDKFPILYHPNLPWKWRGNAKEGPFLNVGSINATVRIR